MDDEIENGHKNEADTTPKSGEGDTMNDTSNRACTRRRLWIGVAAVVLLAAIIVPSVYFATRPEFIEVTETNRQESLPSLIKVAPIATGGAVLVEFTELLSDPTILNYYVTVQDLEFTTLPNVTDIDAVNLYLTRSKIPDVRDNIFEPGAIQIEGVAQTEFPYRLPAGFLPGDYNGVLLLEETGSTRSEVATAAFDVIADPDQNLRSPTPPSPSPTSAPSETPISPPTITPKPTAPPTTPPVDPPTSPPHPPILFSELESDDYNIDGTITIDSITNFVGGKVVDVARMRFDLPEAASAPGPFLYLSKRPYSQTKGTRDLTNDDIYIPIDETADGSFTVEGKYDQLLDEISDIEDVNAYANGSWIVWCRPFKVWLGGGPISAQNRRF